MGRGFFPASPANPRRYDRGVTTLHASAGGRCGWRIGDDLHASSIVQPGVAEIRDGFADLPIMGAHCYRILPEIELKSSIGKQSLDQVRLAERLQHPVL